MADPLTTPTEPVTQLSAAGQQLVHSLSAKYNLSTDAVTHMLIAVSNGNGSMAQFGHPEFGGSGQWMSGGMTMVSDLFNYNLKNLVNNLCSDIAGSLSQHQLVAPSGSFQSQSQGTQSQGGNHSQTQASGQMGSQNSLFVPDPEALWWPKELGSPNATGSQNNVKYAYFAQARRLAVKTGGDPWVYDTGDHQIGGFSQQQGIGGSITFTSQYGTVNLSTLPVVWRGGPTYQEITPTPTPDPIPTSTPTAPLVPAPTHDAPPTSDLLATLEKLGSLMEKGYLSKEEFDAKKADLLSRL